MFSCSKYDCVTDSRVPMTMIKLRYSFAISFLLIQLAGCATATTEGPYYYLLNAQAEQADAIQLPAFNVGLGPVTLPTYLEREGILTFSDNNQLDYSSVHRWAEPLQENVLDVLNANIIRLLPNQQVIFYPWRQVDKPRYQAVINIKQFAFQAENTVTLAATWTLNDQQGEQLRAEHTRLSLPHTVLDYAGIVKAQSKLLAMLSLQIAQALAETTAS